MDEEKKPLLPSTMKKKPPPPPSWSLFLSEVQVFSLKAAFLFALRGCVYAALAAYNLRLRDRQHGSPCHCHCPVPEPAWFAGRYVLTGGDVVDATLALWRGLMWCSAPQAAAAALALALLEGGRSRRGLAVRSAALVALAATAASHWMYLRRLGLARIDSPRDLFLAFETKFIVAAAALDLLGFTAFVVLGADK